MIYACKEFISDCRRRKCLIGDIRKWDCSLSSEQCPRQWYDNDTMAPISLHLYLFLFSPHAHFLSVTLYSGNTCNQSCLYQVANFTERPLFLKWCPWKSKMSLKYGKCNRWTHRPRYFRQKVKHIRHLSKRYLIRERLSCWHGRKSIIRSINQSIKKSIKS